MYTIMTNNMAQIIHFRDIKGKFGPLEKELMINKKLQDLIHMSNTGMPCLTVDQDFIIKDKDKMM